MAPGKVAFGGEPGLSHSVNPGCGLTPVMLAGKGEGWVVGMADRYRHQDGEVGLSGSVFAAAPVQGGEPTDQAQPAGPVASNLDGFKAVGNDRDTLLATWLEWGVFSKPRLLTTRFASGKGWDSEPTELPIGAGIDHGKELPAAVTAGGTAILAWSENSLSPSPQRGSRVRLTSAKPGQGWTEPLLMAGRARPMALGQVAVAAGPEETAAVAWTKVDEGTRTVSIEVSLYHPDRGWSQPQSAAQVQGAVRDGTTLAFTGPDQLVLAYLANDHEDSKAFGLRTVWHAGGRWSPARTHGQPSETPAFGLGSDGNGHALLAWREERRNLGATLLASVADAPATWHPPAQLPAGPADAGSVEHVSAAMGRDGTACALWDTDRAGMRSGWASIFKPSW